ncbi:MAG: glycosyltransferase family 39 protein, partial [Abitibacteriaceae bacterium]|nr:glycosyltransferase family 39 protein [Abditibacteriaceae bacterium]
NRLAINLMDHGVCSYALQPPYLPTVERPPGYPLFLAAIYLVSGRSVLMVRLVQFAFFTATAWLLYLLALRFVNRATAVVTALLCATYWPLLVMPVFHLTETLATFLAVLCVYLWVRAMEYIAHPQRQRWYVFLTGLMCGVATQIRPSFVFFVVMPMVAFAVPAFAPGSQAMSLRQRLSGCGLMALGYALCIVPWAVRNTIVAHRFLPVSANGGLSLYVSAQQYAGERTYEMTNSDWQAVIKERKQHLDAVAAKLAHSRATGADSDIAPSVQLELVSNAQFTQEAKQKFASCGLGRILRSLPHRYLTFWGSNDDPPWTPQNFTRNIILGVLLVAGIWLYRKNIKMHWPLWMMPLYLMAVHTLYHIEYRYSFPARPFLMIYISSMPTYLLSRLPFKPFGK